MKRIYALILWTSLFCLPGVTLAQVTVGSGEKPIKAAILDVKSYAADEDNITSGTGGIIMPRLKLQSPNTLEPIIPNNDPELTELKIYHTGLVVYNLTDDANFKEGLYIWNGARWEIIISDDAAGTSAVTVENGLFLTSAGDYIELGGALDANTDIVQNNNAMRFTTGTGTLSVNAADFIIKEGNTGIGKEPSSVRKLDISGDTQINGGLDVKGETGLKDVEITGTSTTQSHLVYTPDNSPKEQRFLVSTGTSGLAKWRVVGGLSFANQQSLPASTLRFNPVNQTNSYLNTGMGVELSPGKWLINYSVRMVSLDLNSASTNNIKPTSFRFTLLENGVPIPVIGRKAYDDCRAYPDTYYNSYTGFIVLNNDSDRDKVYYLGIKTQEMGLNWPPGDVELINGSEKDAYLIALLMDY
ncbi:MAG: hypothetical protein LBN74_07870 [Prevotella sp.]|jgi:hypothetical protein|nr:hypothetical protein [Prevotella sp.]